jgi:hypothetical protein
MPLQRARLRPKRKLLHKTKASFQLAKAGAANLVGAAPEGIMTKKNKKKRPQTMLDIFKSIRKPPIPPAKIIPPGKRYNRKDKGWKNEY